jgi:hypothetical protein
MAIGGFFPLFSGLNPISSSDYHTGVFMESGRSAFGAVLDLVKPTRVFLPHYLCHAILDACIKRKIEVVRYELDKNLLPTKIPELEAGSLFYSVNYFGLQPKYHATLSEKLGPQLIVDNTHDFSLREVGASWSFTNARKNLGVPDGAFLYGPSRPSTKNLQPAPFFWYHGMLRNFGFRTLSWRIYRSLEERFGHEPRPGSNLSSTLIRKYNLSSASSKRIQNFNYLHKRLEHVNMLNLDALGGVPFCYPLLIEAPVSRGDLAKRGLFLPRYWPEVAAEQSAPAWERFLARNLLPLPVDHRYGLGEIAQIVRILENSEPAVPAE